MALGGGTGYGGDLVARILLTSDYHNLSVAVGQQKGQALKWNEKIFEAVVNLWKRWNIRYAIPRMRRKVFSMTKQGGDFDYHIINGDIVECEYNERGLMSWVDCETLRKTVREIPSGARYENTFVVAGDHELGYRLPLSSDPHGGISPESIDNFFHTIGPLWQSFEVGGIHFLLLSSSLMIQNLGHLSWKAQEQIRKLHEEQRQFVELFLNGLPEGSEVLVFLHDPDALVALDAYIRDYYYMHNKNFQVFCGHMHAEESLVGYARLGRIAQTKISALVAKKNRRWRAIHDQAKGNPYRLELFEKYKLQIVPAPGGMMGKGGGFLTMNIYANGNYQIQKHKI